MRKWLLLSGTVAILIAVFWWWMRQPSVGTVTTPKIEPLASQSTAWIDYQGKTFHFKYPPSLTVLSSEEKKVLLVGTVGLSQQLVVMAKDYSGNLDELSDIKMRSLKNDLYQALAIDDWRCYQKKDVWERVCWQMFGDQVVSVALTANSNDPELEKDFGKIVTSVQLN